MADDVSRADAQRATNDDVTRRRAVLGGVVGAVGAALGLSSTAAAREMAGPDAGSVGPEELPRCAPGCIPEWGCCAPMDDPENCSKDCLYCVCG